MRIIATLTIGLLAIGAKAQTTTTKDTVYSITNALGQPVYFTNREVVVVTDTPLNVTVGGSENATGLQAGINDILYAITGNSTNWYGVIYGLYAPKLDKKAGFGAGVFYPVSKYVVGGVRLDFVDGGFWMPNGTVTFQIPLHPLSFFGGSWSNVVVTPFAYAGIGLPLSGATIVTTSGTATIPGTIRDNNGQATAITGEGVAVILWHRSTPTTSWWQPVSAGAIFDIEQWSGFPGSQYRLGAEVHWVGGK